MALVRTGADFVDVLWFSSVALLRWWHDILSQIGRDHDCLLSKVFNRGFPLSKERLPAVRGI
jgi:hypothetical protein